MTLSVPSTFPFVLAASPATAGDEYEPVTGKDQETVKCVRACEAEAAEKTASDYAHIVWAYGVLWALFAGYGVLLWQRAVRQRVEVADLEKRLGEH
jgi:hypothetical protein